MAKESVLSAVATIARLRRAVTVDNTTLSSVTLHWLLFELTQTNSPLPIHRAKFQRRFGVYLPRTCWVRCLCTVSKSRCPLISRLRKGKTNGSITKIFFWENLLDLSVPFPYKSWRAEGEVAVWLILLPLVYISPLFCRRLSFRFTAVSES